MPLSSRRLLELVLRSIESCGWSAIVVKADKPFEIRIYRSEDDSSTTLHVFIWNCTHGGGAARAADEFRVQFTGVVPARKSRGISLLLGWYAPQEVFAAWDIGVHDGQSSSSPSAQIKRSTLDAARAKQFSIARRMNNENVVAFRPQYLVDYALNSRELHEAGEIAGGLEKLNDLVSLGKAEVQAITDEKRRVIVSTISRRYRATDFRDRVLVAYDHACAMCGVQLELIEAAHVIPVASDESTDNTDNGVALCKLHHAAYDRNVVSFNEQYRIEVSQSRIREFTLAMRAGGFAKFKAELRSDLRLPTLTENAPSIQTIRRARKIRGWTP